MQSGGATCWYCELAKASTYPEIGILLPNNQRQHRTLHIQKDVLTYAVFYLLCPVLAALASERCLDGFGLRLLLHALCFRGSLQ